MTEGDLLPLFLLLPLLPPLFLFLPHPPAFTIPKTIEKVYKCAKQTNLFKSEHDSEEKKTLWHSSCKQVISNQNATKN
jgi:hypothetical protein